MATLTPAYGRDYKSKKSSLEDFNADKDFIWNDHRGSIPTNKSDMIRMGETGFHQLRFNQLRKVIVIEVKG